MAECSSIPASLLQHERTAGTHVFALQCVGVVYWGCNDSARVCMYALAQSSWIKRLLDLSRLSVCPYMCMRVYVCVYVSVYIFMYVYMCLCICVFVCRLGILRLPRKDFHEISLLKFLLKFANIPILINVGQKNKHCV